jgi:ATP-dependent DNA ligase
VEAINCRTEQQKDDIWPYRAVAVKSEGGVHLRSWHDNDFSSRYPAVATALAALPDETVTDGEIVALDGAVRRSTLSRMDHRKRTSSITSSI